ncbi:hypothetical protein [Streptacidiphilus fuscans]|uniref:CBS domain-containing protein n=1 Tax=Streptacidiphilus fuscans TaxID=2789292 RepID=A0A931B3S5_9ACTN|nr:hypothetical protein [Streptacidiphilus fuscans]MBF9069804.1 hypothetical protein [Streptacidiphilus fuscans]
MRRLTGPGGRAETGLTSAPVIDPTTQRPAGVITLTHLLHARLHDLTEEHHRERVLPRPAGDDRITATASGAAARTRLPHPGRGAARLPG